MAECVSSVVRTGKRTLPRHNLLPWSMAQVDEELIEAQCVAGSAYVSYESNDRRSVQCPASSFQMLRLISERGAFASKLQDRIQIRTGIRRRRYLDLPSSSFAAISAPRCSP